MEEILCSPETSLKAKNKGFDIPQPKCCVTLKDGRFVSKLWTDSLSDDCTLQCYQPTQSVLKKWFREVHKLDVNVYCNASGWMWEISKAYSKGYIPGGATIAWSGESGPNDGGEWDEFEDALEDGLKEGLKLI